MICCKCADLFINKKEFTIDMFVIINILCVGKLPINILNDGDNMKQDEAAYTKSGL